MSLQVDIKQDTHLITVVWWQLIIDYFQSCDFLGKIFYVNTQRIILFAHFRVKEE